MSGWTLTSRRWGLGARATALSVAIALVLGVIAAVTSAVALDNRVEVNRLINEDTPLVLDAQGLLNALLNQETGIRGYAVNGQLDDLAPYDQGVRDEADTEKRLLDLLADRPALAAHVRDIQVAMTDWRAQTATPVIAAVRGGDRAAAQSRISEAARNSFENIRAGVGQLQREIDQLRAQTARAVQERSSRLLELLIAASVVIVAAAVLLAVLLRYLVARPVDRLATEVRKVVGGDYEHVVDVEGPPEVARLAGDVEGMRRKIVKDLQEVSRARQLIEETNLRLESQAEELTRSNRDLEQFAYVASHDLQEPLRKVISFCQLLQRRYGGQLDDRADQYITFAVDGAQRMQRLINDLLAFSRIGRITTGFTDVDLDAVVRAEVDEREAAIAAVGGEVTWADLPTVRGDEPLLAALLGNLVGNSIKFRRPGVPPRVHIEARRIGDEWEISCADNGIGIDAEFADKVFVIFQRLHAKEVYPGTGIGLAIAKKIIEYHGGRIWLDTGLGPVGTGGTTIRFTLPAEPQPAPAVRVEPPAVEPPAMEATAPTSPVEEPA
jgi:signal transduction histidine kinase